MTYNKAKNSNTCVSSPWGGHTQIHKHTYIHPHRNNFKKPSVCHLVRTWFKNTVSILQGTIFVDNQIFHPAVMAISYICISHHKNSAWRMLLCINCIYIYIVVYTYVIRFSKTDQIVTFCISRNTNLKCFSHCGSFLLQSSYSYIKFTA